MIRWFLLLIACCGLLGQAVAAIEIIDVPARVAERYDLTWDMTVKSIPSSPLVLGVEELSGKGGYQLRLDKERAEWVQTGVKTPKPVGGAVRLRAGATTSITFKRRPGAVALLQDHRLVFCAPAPTPGAGTVIFRQAPAGLAIEEARYSQVGLPLFGDDFMRPESVRLEAKNTAPVQWLEDSAWQVAFFRKDHPGQNPVDPKTSAKLINPWKLSFYTFVDKTANGFWYLYNGVGPSWVVANENMVYPTWDRYFVEAAVRTEYAGEVGLIAAYQDQQNYLFFRWRQREYVASDHPRAELIAVIDGEQQVLASSPRGFDPVQWYKLRINLGWQRVQVLVDGALLLQAENPGMVEGRIGLYANGAENPWRPEVDQVTASMYVTIDKETGAVINDATDALRRTSVIFFDDVRMGSWEAITDIFSDSPYRMEGDGKWTANRAKGTLQAVTAARLITGPTDWSRYQVSTRVLIPRNGTAGVAFHVNDQGDGYAWLLSADGQKLCPMAQYEIQQTLLAASPVEVKPDTWHDLRVEADGAHVTLYCDDTPVLDTFNPARTTGRCGVLALRSGVQFQALSITPTEDRVNRVAVHKFFESDKWLSAWATPAADWYPVNIPRNLVTPAGLPHAAVGAAAPLPTNEQGLYWHKGGHYRGLRVIIPVSRNTIFGQTLHLSPNYYPDTGYRLRLNMVEGRPTATLLRGPTVVAAQPFTLGTTTRLVFQRIGSYLVLYSLEVDVAKSLDTVEVKSLQLVFSYRDPQPIKAEKLGFTVTVPLLPADALVVESDSLQDTFEQAPDNWLSQSGVWAVMARYSCDPSWNWFGGFGANTPTVWSKYQLGGDQTVEVYMGVKMQYDNMAEEYTRRYRDLNVSICTDGKHLNSGYTFMRAGRYGAQPTTMLLRKGVVVWSSSDAALLLPDKNQGHRR
ncbi:MAG: family 16 glycoside hydrolase [Armatimonadota bacterium]